MDIKNFKTYTNESGFNTPTNLLCKLCPKDVESGGTCSFFAEGNNPGCLKEDYYIECTYDVVANRDSGGTIIDFPVTKLYNNNDFGATAMTIDNGESRALSTGYTFNTEGEHTIRFYKGSPFTAFTIHSFTSCKSLMSVKGAKDIKQVGGLINGTEGAFLNCTKLKSIDLSEKCELLGYYAFKGCSSLIDVGSIKNVHTIGREAFNRCTSLKKVNMKNINSIEFSAFSGCTSLEKIGDLSKATKIWDNGTPNHGSFQNCSSINQDIHLNLETIRYYSFAGCRNIHDLYIDKCTLIEYHAFSNCTKMHAIYMLQVVPPETQYINNVGSFDTTGNCPIYVPEESVQAYKTATNWIRYASRIKPMKKYR